MKKGLSLLSESPNLTGIESGDSPNLVTWIVKKNFVRS